MDIFPINHAASQDGDASRTGGLTITVTRAWTCWGRAAPRVASVRASECSTTQAVPDQLSDNRIGAAWIAPDVHGHRNTA
jgi:hypothetical protein